MKKAGLLLYSMQLALTNVGQTTFGQAKDEELVRETVEENEALSNQQSAVSERQNQRAFTAKDAEDAKENQGLPLINTDDTNRKSLPRMEAHDHRLEERREPVRWKPTPDMYRIGTPEGREAHEASFPDEAATRGAARAVRPVIAPDDRAETHANLG